MIQNSMLSMTGFGRATKTVGAWTVLIEMRSVNHRGLDVRIRMPPAAGSLAIEEALRQAVAAQVKRGAVTLAVHVTRQAGLAAAPSQDIAQEVELAGQYLAALQAKAHALACAPPALDVVWAAIHNSPRHGAAGDQGGGLSLGGDEDGGGLPQAIADVASAALAELLAARRREGQTIADDLAGLVATLRERLAAIARVATVAPTRAAAQLANKIKQLAGAEVSADRIAVEAAAIAARMDIHEELSRARAHLDAFQAVAITSAPGRRLDFLAQELLREVTTMGAKSSDGEILSAVVAAKAELDRIREQVQNVE